VRLHPASGLVSTSSRMNNTTHDPLAHAAEAPNVTALIQEFETAQQFGPCVVSHISAAEDVRYNRWPGKSNPVDGCLWQRNAPQGKVVRPYDGRPDTDVNLADEICSAEVDMDMTALTMARLGADTVHVNPLTASQASELIAMARWVQKAVSQDLARGAELLAQMKASLGWAVLNPGWCERWGLVERQVDMETFAVQLAQTVGPEPARAIYAAILDPTLEAEAVKVVRALFAHLSADRARRVVRELRQTGQTLFVDKQLEVKRPTMRVLIPGYNFFISGGVEDLQRIRGALVVERFYQADLEAMGANYGWNEDFIEAVKATAGSFSNFGAGLKQEAVTSADVQDRGIELWTTYVRQFDPDTKAAGIYVTTFSPHLKPSQGDDAAGTKWYATHYLLDYAHGEYPFCQAEREVIGPALDDSRGAPEMVRSDQKVIKNLQDAQVARAHLEVDPPRAFIGAGWTKTTQGIAPGAQLMGQMVSGGADIKDLSPNKGNPQLSEMAIQRVERGTHRRFALPNTSDGSHPSAWQMRQMRNSRRWLGTFEKAFWQGVVLCYQEFDPHELSAIIGRWPQLTVPDLLHHRVTLSFDARAIDQDWTRTVLEFVIQLLGIDSGGLMDRGPIIQIALAYIDPTLVQNIMRNPAGAQAALYRQVEQDIASIMDMNPPQLRENDASAEMQLQMAFAVLGKNPKYQQLLAQQPQIQENMKTYLENLQHNVQETQLSPQQGRLGVAAMPQRPVQSGMRMEG
jgi:hypothetical protein